MQLDLVLEPDTPQRFAELGRLAESLGFGCVWTANHVASPDPFMAFMPLAAESDRITMGPVAVSPFEIHPVKIANQLLTLNEYAGGRARVVIGGGGGAVIAMGLKPDRRTMMPRMVRAVREAVEMVQGAASGELLNYAGEVFSISGYQATWAKQPAPPIYVAATKPQMLRMAAGVGDGIMLSDATLPRVRECIDQIRVGAKRAGRSFAELRLNNLYTWHVKKDRNAAMAEARAKLFVRGMLEAWYVSPFLTPAEVEFVDANLGAFAQAYIRNTPEIEGVPDQLVEQLVHNLTFCGDFDDIDKFVAQLIEFRDAGLNEFAIRLYAEPENSMRVIAERVMPELDAP
jgi:alkanesulfonate monooxygenase SsuD/methylene tetrahydromethanopterin reductase-like flavin-dependent oxidoreductase (luciferase family)